MSTTQDDPTNKQRITSSSRPASLWRNHDYKLLWSGQALSDIGGAVSELAFPLLSAHDVISFTRRLLSNYTCLLRNEHEKSRAKTHQHVSAQAG